jgi:hypothetical protein
MLPNALEVIPPSQLLNQGRELIVWQPAGTEAFNNVFGTDDPARNVGRKLGYFPRFKISGFTVGNGIDGIYSIDNFGKRLGEFHPKETE